MRQLKGDTTPNWTDECVTVFDEYKQAIDAFSKELDKIDAAHGTYIKIDIVNVQPRPMRIRGMDTKPTHIYREITIDEVIIQNPPVV